MSRSSFIKIRGDLDLSRRLKTFAELPESWNPESLFGRIAPLELEIGSGKGLFLRKAAAASPDHDFIGTEIAYRYALISAAGLAKNGLTNAIALCADAAKLLAERIPSNSLAAVHVYFPDPWWKKAHRKRRILRADVVRLIEDRLLPGGRLFFRTDVEEYYRSTLELLADETKLIGPTETENGVERPGDEKAVENVVEAAHPVQRGADNPPAATGRDGRPEESGLQENDFSTHFERRTRLNHLPVFGCYYVKRGKIG